MKIQKMVSGIGCWIALTGIISGTALRAQAPKVELKPVISTGLSQPMQIVHAGDNSHRLFIVQKQGTVKVFKRIDDEQFTDAGDFLAITDLFATGEQGLLSMAFDPGYPLNGFVYLYFTNNNGNLELARYTVSDDPDRADPASKVQLLEIEHPVNDNHNGGEIHFGTDGFLYVSTGDGGGGGDVPNNAQNSDSYLGKLLRIDVSGGTAAVPEGNPVPGSLLYARGLRNPFRWSFDRETGDVWIGDVGQNRWEEINVIAQDQLADANFGWRCYEGEVAYNMEGCGAGYHMPVYTYAIGNDNGRSVVGGVVYRGQEFPLLKGYYIGADHYKDVLHLIKRTGDAYAVEVQADGLTNISDFGESENGELYAARLADHTVYRITAASSLSVTLTGFSAQIESEGVLLTWTTGEEVNFDRFEVQQSLNAQDYTVIGSVAGKAEEGQGASYSFTDAFPAPGQSYYRLKMVDRDGSVMYSAIIGVNRIVSGTDPEAAEWFILPNRITADELSIKLPEAFEELELVNMSGQCVQRNDLNGKTGSFRLKTGKFPPGIYFARFRKKEKVVVQKLLFTF